MYGSLKEVLFQSKVIGTDDTGVKVLDIKLPFARTGRIWPYYGDREHSRRRRLLVSNRDIHRVVFPLESNLYGRNLSAAAPPHRFLPSAKGGL